MSWVYLFAAIVLEVCGTTCMKLSAGFTRWVPSVLMAVFYAASLGMLTLSLKRIEIGVAYAVWSGVGTALIAAIGVVAFRESATALKGLGVLLIILGVASLHVAGGSHAGK